MFLPYVKPFRMENDSSVIGFGLENEEPTPQEWINRGKEMEQEIRDGTRSPDIPSSYRCDQHLEVMDADWIDEGTHGNVGPHNDMVYFRTKFGDTAGIMIQIVMLCPEIFSESGSKRSSVTQGE